MKKTLEYLYKLQFKLEKEIIELEESNKKLSGEFEKGKLEGKVEDLSEIENIIFKLVN